MTLLLHTGGEETSLADLRALETPEATRSHVPIPHIDVVDMVKYALGFHGHEIIEEAHAITADANRYFGLLSLKSAYGDYTDTVGLRNSHDKTFPIGISFGSRVFVCDNLAFLGDTVIRRKHTANAKRDLPGLVAGVVEPLRLMRQEQNLVIDRYQQTLLDDQLVDHAIMQLYRRGIISVQRIAHVARQWEEPEHDWGDKTAWRLFNAVTFVLSGRVAENPSVTRDLHGVIGDLCASAA
ncbi:DUF932 domain-containing protein [Ruegeria pomeroyi]|nr:DUF932 domain-containing protein [Ruegeria pomeroyi]